MVSIMGRYLMLILRLSMLLFLTGCSKEAAQIEEQTFEAREDMIYNPMCGFAVNADYIDAVGNNTLVYVELTWKDWEPKQGEYAADELWERCYLDRWKEEGKQVVLRFICDNPEKEMSRDIPDWLYEKTGDGTEYDCAYGKGYSPNYNNKTFISCHKKAIEALGKAFGEDDFLFCVELGSLGHWGEWHVKSKEGIEPFPDEAVCAKYVKHYQKAFPNAKLLMRRPFSFVKENGFGVYNDVSGEEEGTKEFLGWIENGGVYYGSKKQMELAAVPQIWNEEPVGGELTSGISMKQHMTTHLKETCELVEASHMTFLGPKCPLSHKELQTYPEAVAKLHKLLGYRFEIPKARLITAASSKTSTNEKTLSVEIYNSGQAPMYKDWPLCLYVLDENGQVLNRLESEEKTTKLLPGKTKEVTWTLPSDEWETQTISYAVGIENPATGEPAVTFASKTEMVGKMAVVWTRQAVMEK